MYVAFFSYCIYCVRNMTKTNTKPSIVIDNNKFICTYLKAHNKSRYDESVDDILNVVVAHFIIK